ncbi:MAG: O-antigen ligase family protein, partial [Elusimicrobiota bacterium]
MKKVKLNYIQLVFLAALFISPLIFFTGVTRNPYLIQERILQVLLSFSVLMLFIKSKGFIKFPVTFLDRPLWFFFLIALVSYLLSFLRYPDFRWSFLHYGLIRNLMFIFSGLTVFYFTAGSRDNFTEKIKKAVIAAGSIAALYAVVQFFNSVIDSVNFDFIWGEALDPYGERSISTFGNPNFLSAYLMVTIFWIMGYIFTEKKVMWGFLFVLNTSALAITMTRSTLVSFVLGVAALIFILSYQYGRKYRRFKKAMLAIFSAIILVGFLFFGISDQFRQRVRAMASTQEMGSALVQRLLIWESSANMFIEDPVIGRGWGNFEVFYPFYQGKVVEKEEYRPLRTHANNAHNFMLEILTQTGIVGAGIYIWLMVVFVVFAIRIFKAADEKDKIWVAVFAVAAISFWIDNLLNVSLYFPLPALAFWVNAGLLASKGRKNYLNPHKTINFRKFKIILLFVCMAVAGVLYFNYIYFKSNVYFFKGFKYARMNKLEQAEDKFLKAWNIYPLIVDNNYELGNIYVSMSRSKEQDKLKQAAWAYKQALRANPGYDEIYYNLGVVYL